MEKDSRLAVMRLPHVLMRISPKLIYMNNMCNMKKDLVATMFMFEMHMPPNFFEVMLHLVIHLIDELELCGHVHTQ